ncbi:unnamed protein product, partial [Allacma fusca]
SSYYISLGNQFEVHEVIIRTTMASYAAVSTGRSDKPPGKILTTMSSSSAVVQDFGNAREPCHVSSSGEDTLKKKNRRKKVSKTERQRRKEEETFKKLYGPKDSHIQLISPAVLQKLNDQNYSKPSKSSTEGYVYSIDEFPTFTTPPSDGPLKSLGGISQDDFPALIPNVKPIEPKTPPRLSIKTPLPRVEPENQKIKEEVSPEKSEGSLSNERSIGEAQSCSKDEESGWETENDNPGDDGPVTKTIKNSSINKKEHPEVSGSSEPAASSSKKKSKNPFVISLDALIKVNKSDAVSKRREIKKSKLVKKEMSSISEKKTLGNTLDASGPVLIKRGKMREKPRKKKMSALKKAILMSRALRASKTANRTIEEEQSPESNRDTRTSPIAIVKTEVSDTSVAKVQDSDFPILKVDVVAPRIKTTGSVLVEAGIIGKYCKGQQSKELNAEVKVEADKLEHESKLCFEKASTHEVLTVRSQNSPSSQNENVFASLLDNAIKSQEDSTKDRIVKPEPEVVTVTDEVGPEIIMEAKKTMHSRKFRPYCNMYVSKELHGHLIALMKELHRFQDRLYHSDPIKFQSKRRYVHGLKDTNNYLEINKVCLVLLAPDVESNDVRGGLDDKIATIIRKATSKNVPIVFSGNRFILGKLIMIKSQVSAIAVLDKQGAEDLFRTVICESEKLREKYENDLNDKVKQLTSKNSSDRENLH